jgi:hypothetical protein
VAPLQMALSKIHGDWAKFAPEVSFTASLPIKCLTFTPEKPASQGIGREEEDVRLLRWRTEIKGQMVE